MAPYTQAGPLQTTPQVGILTHHTIRWSLHTTPLFGVLIQHTISWYPYTPRHNLVPYKPDTAVVDEVLGLHIFWTPAQRGWVAGSLPHLCFLHNFENTVGVASQIDSTQTDQATLVVMPLR